MASLYYINSSKKKIYTSHVGSNPCCYIKGTCVFNRSNNNEVKATFTMYAGLEWAESYLGTGHQLSFTYKIGNNISETVEIKGEKSVWRGTDNGDGWHKFTKTITFTSKNVTQLKVSVHLGGSKGYGKDVYDKASNSTIYCYLNTPKLLYTKCGAPSNVRFSSNYAVPYEDITISWDAGTDGTSNPVSGYRFAYRWNTYGEKESDWRYIQLDDPGILSQTLDSSFPPEYGDYRGKYLEVRVRTKGRAGDSYFSDYTSSAILNTNIKPPNPKASVTNTFIPSDQEYVVINLTADLYDQDRRNNLRDQQIDIYEAIGQGGYTKINRTTESFSVTREAPEEGASKTFFYKTSDGYEESDVISITITRNKKPTININNYNNVSYRSGVVPIDNDVFIEKSNYPNEIMYTGKTTLDYHIDGYNLPNRNFVLNEKIIFNTDGSEYVFSNKNYNINTYNFSYTYDILDKINELGVKWRIELYVTDGMEYSNVIKFPTVSGNKKYYYIPNININNIYNQYDIKNKIYTNNNIFYKQLRIYYKTNTGFPLQYVLLVNKNNTSDKLKTTIISNVNNNDGTSYVDLLVNDAIPGRIYYPALGLKNVNSNNYILLSSPSITMQEVTNLPLHNLVPNENNINVYTESGTSLFTLGHEFNSGLVDLNGKKYFEGFNLNPNEKWLKIFIRNPLDNSKKMELKYEFSNDTTDNDLRILVNWKDNIYDFINNPLNVSKDNNVTEDLVFEIIDNFGKITQSVFSNAINYIFITKSFITKPLELKVQKYNFNTDNNWLQQNLPLTITNEINSYNFNKFLASVEIKYYTTTLENSEVLTEVLNIDNNIFSTELANSQKYTIQNYNTTFNITSLKPYPYCKLRIKYKETSGKNYEITSNWTNYIKIGFLEPLEGTFNSILNDTEGKNEFNFNFVIEKLNYNKLLPNNSITFDLITSKTIPFENSISGNTPLEGITLTENIVQNKTISAIMPNSDIYWDFLYQGIKSTSILTQTFSNDIDSFSVTTEVISYTIPFIVYNITPTLAYRIGALGINTANVNNKSVLDIGSTQDKYKITFKIPGPNHQQAEILLGNGQIDGPEQCFLNLFEIDGGEW